MLRELYRNEKIKFNKNLNSAKISQSTVNTHL